MNTLISATPLTPRHLRQQRGGPGRLTACCMALLLTMALPACENNTPSAQSTAIAADSTATYQYAAPNRDGIGKFYFGREISQVMGHQGAAWLERSEREREERSDILITQLGLRATDVVADIGAGTGYFAFRMSPLVPQGKVMAVDIQQEMLDIIAQRSQQTAANVFPVLGVVSDINLAANSIDLVLLVDAYHEFSHPREMAESIFLALKPGGRMVLVEYRGEDPSVRIKPLHKMTEAQAIKEIAASGLAWLETRSVLPQQHILIFTKPGTP